MRLLVIGGTGTISSWMVHHALGQGHQVTVLNRGKSEPVPAGVEALVADRHDPAALAAVLRGRAFDATADFLVFDVPALEQLVTALPRHGHLILCSTVCALGTGWTTFPIAESAVPAPTTGYGIGKAKAETWLLDYAQRTGSAVTIVRPSCTFDQRIGVLRQVRWDGAAWLGRIRAGLPVLIQDGGMALMQFMHADDAGRGFAALLGKPVTHGRTYHLVGSATTWADHHRLVMEALGRQVPLLSASGAQLDQAGIPDDGLRREIFAFHGCYAAEGLARDVGFTPAISLADAIARTLPGIDPARIGAPERDGWEDRLIARLGG